MDLLEICHSPELILRAYEALIAEAERSAAFRKLLLDAGEDRTARQRARLFAATDSDGALQRSNSKRCGRRFCSFSETIAKRSAAAEAKPA